ncbi:MAG: hypothetical protein ACRDTF_02945, partial [Pseudonocardiaceae bacterium]
PKAGPPESGRLEAGRLEFGSTGHEMAVAVHRPQSRPPEPLLLVDLAVAASRSAREHPIVAGQHEPARSRVPVAGHVPAAGQDAGGPRSADRAASALRQPSAPIDVERIVDAVHRRFVRRLAIEAERRAVR